MKKISLLILVLLSANYTYSQSINQQAAKQSAFSAAKAMDEALINRRFEDYVSFNHPKVLEQVKGGRQAMIIEISKQVNNMHEAGNTITAIWPQAPTVVIDTAEEWQCTLQQYMTYRLPEGKIKSETTIIGISPDKGTKWYFIDAAGRTLSELKEIFPTLSSKLIIPKPKEAEFTAEN